MLLRLKPLHSPMESQPSPPIGEQVTRRMRLEDILDQCPIEILQAVLFLLRTRRVSTTAS